MRERWLGHAGLALAAMLLPLVSNSEIYVERQLDAMHEGASGVVRRQILVNGIATVSRSWTSAQTFPQFAVGALRSVKARPGLGLQVQMSQRRLQIVQMLPGEGQLRAHVLFAQPTAIPDRTVVWEAELSPGDLLAELAAERSGAAPGRDHPFVGAPAGSRRVNVVESVGSGYQYSAIYLSGDSPCGAIASLVGGLTARGATEDTRDAHAGSLDCSAALSFAGHQIDLQASRDASSAATHIIVQTDIPPNQSREHS
ncbi:MAG TPA: hypothetical protein VIK97_03090 [Casimicrobiaceae bacterium]